MVMPDRLFPATAMDYKTWWRALWPDPDGVVRALHIEPGMTVVDLGCGDGYFTAAIARQISPVHIIGVDLDPAMLAQAKVACEGENHCDWVLGDAMDLRHLIRSAVDFVLIANTFHGVPDKTALAREVAAILVPTGASRSSIGIPLPAKKRLFWGSHEGREPSCACRPTPRA